MPIAEDGSLRCVNCNKKLGDHFGGSVTIKCPRCGIKNTFIKPK